MLSAKPAEQDPHHTSSDSTISRPSPPTHFPFHPIPGVSNFRDIGGWPLTTSPSSSPSSPKHVRKRILYRGADTNRITASGISALKSLGITTDFDLRSKQQIEKTGGFKDMSEAGIQRIWAPVFGEEECTEERARQRYELYAGEGTEGIVTAFVEILTAGAEMLHTVLTHLLAAAAAVAAGTEDPPPAVFMHCTTGNNRTGVFVSLLLMLLGVPRSSIVYEYTLSEQGLAPTRHVNVERLLKKGAFEECGPEEARRKCERMVGARAESMEALLREVDKRWGGAEGYFTGDVGLTDEQIARLRQLFTVEGEAEGEAEGLQRTESAL